jgi:hypothetical protein
VLAELFGLFGVCWLSANCREIFCNNLMMILACCSFILSPMWTWGNSTNQTRSISPRDCALRVITRLSKAFDVHDVLRVETGVAKLPAAIAFLSQR